MTTKTAAGPAESTVSYPVERAWPGELAQGTDELDRAARLAAEAGRWDVVALLGRKLEARRLAGCDVIGIRSDGGADEARRT